jgi:hypothetical protein
MGAGRRDSPKDTEHYGETNDGFSIMLCGLRGWERFMPFK